MLADYVPRYFDALLPVWNSRSAAIRERLIGKEYPLAFYPLGLAGPELVATTEAWLAANVDAPQALRRLVLEKLDAARTAVVAQQCDAKRA
jgi:aminopeptidase N